MNERPRHIINGKTQEEETKLRLLWIEHRAFLFIQILLQACAAPWTFGGTYHRAQQGLRDLQYLGPLGVAVGP